MTIRWATWYEHNEPLRREDFFFNEDAEQIVGWLLKKLDLAEDNRRQLLMASREELYSMYAEDNEERYLDYLRRQWEAWDAGKGDYDYDRVRDA